MAQACYDQVCATSLQKGSLPLHIGVGMELLTVLTGLVVAFASILFILQRQRAQYSKHVAQLKPAAKEKRSVAKREFREYTREEVAQHNKPDDAWIIVKDKRTQELRVYDVSEYVDEHPGGESILNHAGGDATEGFHGPQHPDAVFVMAETWCIGKMVDKPQ